VFSKPQRVEKIISETQSKDAQLLERLAKAGITAVIVPDEDPDHQPVNEELFVDIRDAVDNRAGRC